jgi:dTDP-4-dehydrorhamnose 3,5-epimerase
MYFTKTDIEGVWIISPDPHMDDRGRFMRAWCMQEFRDHGIDFVPVQANMGFSLNKGTTRGMHYQQEPALEAKLIRCTKGAIFDVAVDLRKDATTYGQWVGYHLTANDGCMLYVPGGCAHGYQTLENDTEIYYMASAFYTPDAVRGMRFDDPAVRIQWPLVPTSISPQDLGWPLLSMIGVG